MNLHDMLKGKSVADGKIDLHTHISDVKLHAVRWLEGIPKNAVDHSRRLEDYLNRLIPDKFKKKLKPAEIFILLYAVYLHDIGYRKEDGTIESRDHPLRSKQYTLASFHDLCLSVCEFHKRKRDFLFLKSEARELPTFPRNIFTNKP